MAGRFRRYFKECKGKRAEGDRHGKLIEKGKNCNGKRGSYCPVNIPNPCGSWAIDYREFDGRWISKVFTGISKTGARELLEEIKSNIRRKMMGLPSMAKLPTFAEYAKTYMETSKTAKEKTLLAKQRAVRVLTQYLA